MSRKEDVKRGVTREGLLMDGWKRGKSERQAAIGNGDMMEWWEKKVTSAQIEAGGDVVTQQKRH